MLKKKPQKYQATGAAKRVISLNNGEHAYLFDAEGKTHHLRTDSEEFIERCADIDGKLNGAVVRNLEELGWTELAERVKDAAAR